MDGQTDDEVRKILEQKALDILEEMSEAPDDVLSFQAGFVAGWIMRDENQAIYEPLTRPPELKQPGSNVFSVRMQDAPVVYYPFEGNPFAPSEQSGGNFIDPEFEIESSPGSVFECVEGDGYDDLKTGKKLRWHDVSTQVGKSVMKPFYDGKPPTYVDFVHDERGKWKKFTWPCGYNISVRVE